jgi:hypothetical protein
LPSKIFLKQKYPSIVHLQAREGKTERSNGFWKMPEEIHPFSFSRPRRSTVHKYRFLLNIIGVFGVAVFVYGILRQVEGAEILVLLIAMMLLWMGYLDVQLKSYYFLRGTIMTIPVFLYFLVNIYGPAEQISDPLTRSIAQLLQSWFWVFIVLSGAIAVFIAWGHLIAWILLKVSGSPLPERRVREPIKSTSAVTRTPKPAQTHRKPWSESLREWVVLWPLWGWGIWSWRIWPWNWQRLRKFLSQEETQKRIGDADSILGIERDEESDEGENRARGEYRDPSEGNERGNEFNVQMP